MFLFFSPHLLLEKEMLNRRSCCPCAEASHCPQLLWCSVPQNQHVTACLRCRSWGREQRSVGLPSCHCRTSTRHFMHENNGHCTSVGTCQVKRFGFQKRENTVLCWLELQGILAPWCHWLRVPPACSILLPCTGTRSLLRPFFYKRDDWGFPRWNIQWQGMK